jgi:AraC family transcriptional regulator of adaptative response/methylated-DNA-[protein]-cysteine methyltransferase
MKHRAASGSGSYATDEDRWAAVVQRERGADGRFVYAVRTTGVFCRPACPSRQPLRKNVRFFAQSEEASRAGFRPCLRCRPLESPMDEIASILREACRRLERDGPAANRDVARAVGLSPFYFQRLFKDRMGVTPRAYRRRVVAERAKEALASGSGTVARAIYEAGYSASSRFYEGAGRELGMPPRTVRGGGVGEEVRFALRRCSLGVVLIAWTSRGVCEVDFGDSREDTKRALVARFPQATLARTRVPTWVAEVVKAADRPRIANIPLDIQGTAFQQRVWSELRRIPIGETRTYAEIARAIGAPTAARAVAAACASNQLALVVPCHRVIAGNGDIAGYRWGKARKQALLARESRSS